MVRLTLEHGGKSAVYETYAIQPMAMAIPLENSAGKFVILARVTFPPAVVPVPIPEVKSNNH